MSEKTQDCSASPEITSRELLNERRRSVERLSDVDLAVELVPKEMDRDLASLKNRQRAEELADQGAASGTLSREGSRLGI